MLKVNVFLFLFVCNRLIMSSQHESAGVFTDFKHRILAKKNGIFQEFFRKKMERA